MKRRMSLIAALLILSASEISVDDEGGRAFQLAAAATVGERWTGPAI
ncbi:MAG TPA: hypothetical protein VFV50_06320 [Bdellovibrionales bacterium]|nr:hypothetical protein [Bdellovibrionales bacterium]